VKQKNKIMKHIVVLGGGFAGVESVFRLRKLGHKVTLVSDRDYCFVYPISIWVPVRKIDFEDVKLPLADLQKVHKFDLIIDEVKSIVSKENKVILAKQTIEYDYLIIAFGGSKLSHPGLEHTFSICGKPEEATELYERLDALVLKGSGKIAMGFGGNAKDSSAVRGGPAFEVLFNVDTYLKRKGIRKNFELTFFAPMEKPGMKMGEKALIMMDKMFKMTNIHKQVGSKITSFDAEGINFEDGTKIESDLTMFISAGTGHSVIEASDL